ncbi:MAG: hypothetical protein LBR76_00085 [Oscillospiraceae bacterium]|jgi:hypothetical protein|nr:hypothetical protein [Oscillospiraceae bacterium]
MNTLTPFDQLDTPLDRLNTLRALLSYPLINWVSQFFSRTRDGQTELYFVQYCRAIIEENEGELGEEELEFFDKVLIGYQLGAYDRLNWWQEYVDFFNLARRSKRYTKAFAKRADHPGMDEYLLWEDGNYKHVHFLFFVRHRYEVIQRKLERLISGKSTKHLERHQIEDLTEEQVKSRHEEMARLFEFIKQQ